MIRNPFQKEKKEKKKVKAAPSREPVPATAPTKKAAAKVSALGAVVLRMPHVTEKAVALAGKNQYVFRVAPHSTKHAVKQAVEEVYGVEVRGVHVISVPSKRMRRGRIQGKKPGYRKAIVRVKEGQKIDILPV